MRGAYRDDPYASRLYATAKRQERAAFRAAIAKPAKPIFEPSEADRARALNMTGGKTIIAGQLLREWEQQGLLEGQP